jgi:hypothetical protein
MAKTSVVRTAEVETAMPLAPTQAREAVSNNAWAEYERRIPGFRERMLRARQELEAGKGVPLDEAMTARS